MARILVASSGATMRNDLRAALRFKGHIVAEADTAAQTVQEACSKLHDLLVVDSALDGITAYELSRRIRSESEIGILVLGAKTGTNAIDALNAGADDYVPPPFVMEELTGRAEAILRRLARPGGKQIALADRTIDLEAYRILGPDERVSRLTPKEFLVLQALITFPNKTRTHQYLAKTIWQRDGKDEVCYLRAVIKQLRRKLEPDPDNPQYIVTEHSIGYRFDLPEAEH